MMAPDIWVNLSVKPAGARPIEMLFAVRKHIQRCFLTSAYSLTDLPAPPG